jgi:hypothetical protein
LFYVPLLEKLAKFLVAQAALRSEVELHVAPFKRLGRLGVDWARLSTRHLLVRTQVEILVLMHQLTGVGSGSTVEHLQTWVEG